MSVDLSGSTAYKHSITGSALENGTPRWVTVFQQFYDDFPARFRSHYQSEAPPQTLGDKCPELWKPVGDELIFCGRVRCAKSIQVALSAFLKALNEYRVSLSERCPQLNVKGAAWLAAFPEPNRTVWIKQDDASKDFLTAAEALEAAADDRPFDFDFLGRALDTGFRVARWSTPERFVLSVQLARLLARRGQEIGFAPRIRLDRPVELKGVNGGEPYPIIYFDSMENLNAKPLREKERTLLGTGNVPSPDDLAEYLDIYCRHVGTDDIPLRLSNSDAEATPPESYLKAKEDITKHLQYERNRKFSSGEPEPADLENKPDEIKFDELKD